MLSPIKNYLSLKLEHGLVTFENMHLAQEQNGKYILENSRIKRSRLGQRKVHKLTHEYFIFIRKKELLIRDEQVLNIDCLVKEGQFNLANKSTLFHEIEIISEARW